MKKHDEQCEADGATDHHNLWKHLAGDLARLAGHATEVQGQVAVKFYVADGKYKQQVFALEDTREGTIALYLPDVLPQALSQKILTEGSSAHHYKVRGETEQVELVRIDAETRDLSACKGMVGWGRRAVRVEFKGQTSKVILLAIDRLCQLAAQQWATPKA